MPSATLQRHQSGAQPSHGTHAAQLTAGAGPSGYSCDVPRFVVSVVLEALEQLSPGIEGLSLNGANIQVARILGNLLTSERLECLEIFLPPAEYLRRDVMTRLADRLLPAEFRGRGRLRFYSLFDLPAVWSDACPRVLLCLSPELVLRDRYLRDSFAVGPTAISCQVHALGRSSLYGTLGELVRLPRAPFDLMTCLSRSAKESVETALRQVAEHTAALPCNLAIVPNAVDGEIFHPLAPDERVGVRKELELPEESTIALYVGRLTPYDKADLVPLVRAFAAVSRESDRLVVAGPENLEGYGRRLLDEAERRGVEDRMILRPSIGHEATALLYGASDLFAFPCDNIQETFGNTVAEAMACGLPVIASDWDGIRDQVEHGVNGLLVPTYVLPGLESAQAVSPALPTPTNYLFGNQCIQIDWATFGQELRRLLHDPLLRKRLGEQARETVVRRNRWQAIESRLFDAWDSALEGAAQESEESRQTRRTGAERSALQVRFADYLRPFANPHMDAVSVTLSEFGRGVLNGQERLEFYDELLPVIRPEVIDCLMISWSDEADRVPFEALVSRASQATGMGSDVARLHVLILLKAGALEISASKSQETVS